MSRNRAIALRESAVPGRRRLIQLQIGRGGFSDDGITNRFGFTHTMCEDLDRFLRQLDSAIASLRASAPADCVGEDRLHYLQFVTDVRELADRGECLRQRLATDSPPSTAGDRETLGSPLPLV